MPAIARPTLFRPPPPDPGRSPIENDLEVTAVSDLGEDIFTNTRPPWHPPGARGVYGGSVVAMSLAAGQRTVPARFALHSLHCYFLLAGHGQVPILFHVERVRDGRSFATRTVQARQRGKCIFTVTMSFTKPQAAAAMVSLSRPNPVVTAASSAGILSTPLPLPPPQPRPQIPLPVHVQHAAASPPERPPLPGPGYGEDDDAVLRDVRFARILGADDADNPPQPIMAGPLVLVGGPAPTDKNDGAPYYAKSLQWVRVRGRISAAGGSAAHLTALAYMSDRYFIGTICRLHRLWRFPFSVEDVLASEKAAAADGADGADTTLPFTPSTARDIRTYIEADGGVPLEAYRGRPSVGMVVSLDHTLYVHEPARVRADEWLLAEMASPWAGAGRGVVTQRLFAADGTLLATCIQEGIIRLKEPEPEDTNVRSKI
ncbi:acyl-thioesterase 2 [Niveomyces insectorum RCEF 264]|uniref:Acyl-thioesterase 2 n=1 Tax=Niveomyces insectorum RCEF 264 TaxID=1081102 RepID=A0A167TBB9_9HYPO|nr:acyl-thioesterase 2 [Niveomyces insectorum RCEF 264]